MYTQDVAAKHPRDLNMTQCSGWIGLVNVARIKPGELSEDLSVRRLGACSERDAQKAGKYREGRPRNTEVDKARLANDRLCKNECEGDGQEQNLAAED